jgi:hypothetical protein
MKRINLFLLIVIVAIIVSLITFLIIDRATTARMKYVMDVEVIEEDLIGINVDPDGLHFGRMKAGDGAGRSIIINNVEDDVLVTVVKKGEMAEWVNNPSGFILRKGNETTLLFSISIPEGTPARKYNGEVIIILRKI